VGWIEFTGMLGQPAAASSAAGANGIGTWVWDAIAVIG
jgi:hypothetical protein